MPSSLVTDPRRHRQEVADTYPGEKRVALLELGEPARDRLVEAADRALFDGDANQRGEERLRDREARLELLAGAAVEVTLVDEAPALKHDERAGGVLLKELVQPKARRGSRQLPGVPAGSDLARREAVAILDVGLTPGNRPREAGRPGQQVRRAVQRSGERCKGEEDEANTSHSLSSTAPTQRIHRSIAGRAPRSRPAGGAASRFRHQFHGGGSPCSFS
jgi:hypothetical protein